MGTTTALNTFTNSMVNIGNFMTSTIGIILGIVVGLVGLGWAWSRFTNHAVGGSSSYRNLPGDKDYDPSKPSYREGRGKNVYVPQGGRIF